MESRRGLGRSSDNKQRGKMRQTSICMNSVIAHLLFCRAFARSSADTLRGTSRADRCEDLDESDGDGSSTDSLVSNGSCIHSRGSKWQVRMKKRKSRPSNRRLGHRPRTRLERLLSREHRSIVQPWSGGPVGPPLMGGIRCPSSTLAK